MKGILRELNKRLEFNSLDGFIASSQANVSYLAGFPAADAYILVSRSGITYFTDSRYTLEVKRKLKGKVSLKDINGSAFKEIAAVCVQLGLKKIGFEERHLPYAEYRKIKECLKAKAYLIPVHGMVEGMRQVKQPQELIKIRQALKIAGLALDSVKDCIRPGIRELEVAAELERSIRYFGAGGSSFSIIVAAGANSAFPHHKPTSRKLGLGEAVLIDAGADYMGYKSDLTRVFFLGKINTLARRIHALVLKAQSLAIKKIRPGARACEIDSLSRNYIYGKGYGKFFVHSLGHGIGLDVHEAPAISVKNEERLSEGMVFTIEPAVYLPGKFGIRIEDMVLVTRKGCEVLSGAIN